MDITLLLAGVRFRFASERSLDIDPMLKNFIISTHQSDVTIRISWDWENLSLRDISFLGEDAICSYYRRGEPLYCMAKGGKKGPLACASYDVDCSEILCVINEKPFLAPPKSLGSILRMIPIRTVFQRFGVLFFHASQIAHRGRGILFSAPSGTGKTTQAKLWHDCRGAHIVCNDRTLIRKVDGIWNTYGYPLDGSEPVRSSDVNTLGAIVLLAQGQENRVERLRPSRAAGLLMEQMVIDTWNPAARNTAMEAIFSLIREIPVYLLTCTPDEQAVMTLEEALVKDEVIPYG